MTTETETIQDETPKHISGRVFKFSATFKFDLAPQATVSGEVIATAASTAASRAVKALFKAHPKRQPRSLVVVLEYPETS